MNEKDRFFVPAEISLQGDQVVLHGETLHHMRDVLRLRSGARVMLFDGAGLCCEVLIEQVDRQRAEARVLGRRQVTENLFPITVIQSVPKGDKFDLVLQKGTELGVSVFQPVLTERTIPRVPRSKVAQREFRWQKIVREAARQSRRSLLPELRPVCPLAEALTTDSPHLKLALWEAGARPLAELLPVRPPVGVTVLIGPEGGLSDQEVALATKAGFKPVHLGPRILRTETAGLAVTPILQYLYGDWQNAPTDEEFQENEE